MNFLIFKYKFWRLKRKYKNFLKLKSKYISKSIEKKKFFNFFIKDEEDKILNEKVLTDFDKKINKYKINLLKKENEINKILFNLGIIDLNYIDIFYKFKISKEDSQIIKEIFKNKINSEIKNFRI